MTVTIYHNSRCSKSRATLALLEERGIAPKIVAYLETPPTAAELDAILKALGKEPRELMRKGEEIYWRLDLDSTALDREALIKAMVQNPILIERPIVTNGEKAAVGRPPESVLEIL